MQSKFKNRYWIDMLIAAGYIIFQARLPIKFLNSGERLSIAETFLTLLLMIVAYIGPVIPMGLSLRWGFYLMIFLEVFWLGVNRYYQYEFAVAQYVSILLICYIVARLSGNFGPPLKSRKEQNVSLD